MRTGIDFILSSPTNPGAHFQVVDLMGFSIVLEEGFFEESLVQGISGTWEMDGSVAFKRHGYRTNNHRKQKTGEQKLLEQPQQCSVREDLRGFTGWSFSLRGS